MGKNRKYENAANLYSQLSAQNTGRSGYTNSLEMAQKGASAQANAAQSQVQTNSRNSGMNKSASALMGNQSVANSYNNSFNNQQQMATQQLQNQLNAQGNLMSSQQAEGNNRYNRAWGNVSNTLSTVGEIAKFAGAFSDERLKNYKDISSKIVSDGNLKDEKSFGEKLTDAGKKYAELDKEDDKKKFTQVEGEVADYKNVSDERLKVYYNATRSLRK